MTVILRYVEWGLTGENKENTEMVNMRELRLCEICPELVMCEDMGRKGELIREAQHLIKMVRIEYDSQNVQDAQIPNFRSMESARRTIEETWGKCIGT